MPPALLTTHALSALAGDPHARIQLTKLSSVLAVGTDAWGRPGLPQPVLLSCALSLRHAFTSAASSDTVAESTMHYGTLGKAILRACEEFAARGRDGGERGRERGERESESERERESGERRESESESESESKNGTRDLLAWLLRDLTGEDVFSPSSSAAAEEARAGNRPLLKPESLLLLELEVRLPKASLMGDGVSVTGAFAFAAGRQPGAGPSAYSMVLRLSGLRVPTLVGVNGCERLAKQLVLVGVELQRWDGGEAAPDAYAALEELVVKSTEESSFQTLEALAAHLAARVIRYFVVPRVALSAALAPRASPRVKISLSKPTAVTFAEAPTVEMATESAPAIAEMAKRVGEAGRVSLKVPFPLAGRLDDWIQTQEGGG